MTASMPMNLVDVFPWNPNFETGIARIDEQHQQLVRLLNELASHLAFQSDAPTLKTVFDELADYAVYHFQTEEGIWHQFLAEDEVEAQHKAAHAGFIEQVLKIQQDSQKSLDAVLEEVLLFLTHWLAFHILDNDMRLAKVVLAVQSGVPLLQAKHQAEVEMSGAMKVLIETILTMYDTLSARTLQLNREMTEHQKAQEKLRLAANVVENTLDAICITDEKGVIMDANPSFFENTGSQREEVINKPLAVLKNGLAEEGLSREIWQHVRENSHWSGEVPSRTASGEVEHEWLTLSSIKDAHGTLRNYVAVFSNITHLIKRQRKLERIAHHDALTGLPNRLLLADRLEQAVIQAQRHNFYVAVCFIDLDGFKPVNDHFGHAAGDTLLQEIAKRLSRIKRGNDTVARIGGDEFIVLFSALKHAEDYRMLIERALSEIALPVQLGETSVQVTASIGVTLYPDDPAGVAELMQHADEAMYQAKKLGKSQYVCYAAPHQGAVQVSA